MQKLLAIVGPTAVGKSAVALEVAKRLNVEIVSADSMQVYLGVDIGTAKPSLQELKEVKHHLINLVIPSQDFSVAEYQKLAREAINEIESRARYPILVGGSGLYIRAVIDDLKFPQGLLGSPVRLELEKEAALKGGEALYFELKRLDPEAAKKIHPRNVRRVIRALEVIKVTGRLFSDFQKEWEKRESVYDLIMVGLDVPRDELFTKIEQRIERQLEEGVLEEVKMLLSQGYGGAITAKQALGYKELADYLEGKCSLAVAVDQFKRRTRNFAKRQLTWFRRDPRINWIDVSGKTPSEVTDDIISYLQKKNFEEA